MYKYSPINSYSLQNLFKSQIYFNNPLNFNDPFDTFHPATIGNLTDDMFVSLLSKFYNNKFDKKNVLDILKRRITKEDFFNFCNEHIDYLFQFDKDHNIFKYRSKENFLKEISESQDQKENNYSIEVEEIFSFIKDRLQIAVNQSIYETRKNIFSKVGVCCFSKNLNNLLMWSYYADSHKGICLEFDSNIEPFSKYFEVIYKSEIPEIDSDLLFKENHKFQSFKKLLSYKSEDWKHEEEIRLLHQEKERIFKYPRYGLKAIYFGIKTDSTDMEMVCSLAKAQNPKIRFFKMKRLESQFAIEPVEFFYSTPVEVQSKLFLEIKNSFGENQFELIELYEIIKIHIEKENLKNHLNELVRNGILEVTNQKYKLNHKSTGYNTL
jgi:hypothetical protein